MIGRVYGLSGDIVVRVLFVLCLCVLCGGGVFPGHATWLKVEDGEVHVGRGWAEQKKQTQLELGAG